MVPSEQNENIAEFVVDIRLPGILGQRSPIEMLSFCGMAQHALDVTHELQSGRLDGMFAKNLRKNWFSLIKIVGINLRTRLIQKCLKFLIGNSSPHRDMTIASVWALRKRRSPLGRYSPEDPECERTAAPFWRSLRPKAH